MMAWPIDRRSEAWPGKDRRRHRLPAPTRRGVGWSRRRVGEPAGCQRISGRRVSNARFSRDVARANGMAWNPGHRDDGAHLAHFGSLNRAAATSGRWFTSSSVQRSWHRGPTGQPTARDNVRQRAGARTPPGSRDSSNAIRHKGADIATLSVGRTDFFVPTRA